MWKHKTKWLVRGGRKVKCYLCGKKILAKGDLFLFHGDTGYYSHQSCLTESTTISGNERRKAVKKIAVGAAVVGAIAAGAGKFLDVSSQSKNSPAAQTILTSQGLIPPALTSDPANPVPGQMWYRSDAGVMAHFDGVQNRVAYSSEINDGNVHVTSKGIVNGLSVLPNDGTGWFGPDTTKGATAPGQYGAPYTETSGIQDATSYVFNNGGGKICFTKGTYNISAPATALTSTNAFLYIPENPITNPGISITLEGEVAINSPNSPAAPVPKEVIFNFTNPNYSNAWLLECSPDYSQSQNLRLTIKNIHFQEPPASSTNPEIQGIDYRTVSTMEMDNVAVIVDAEFDSGSPATEPIPNPASLSVYSTGINTTSYSNGINKLDNIVIYGYTNGITIAGQIEIRNIGIGYCNYAIVDNGTVNMHIINNLNTNNCAYTFAFSAGNHVVGYRALQLSNNDNSSVWMQHLGDLVLPLGTASTATFAIYGFIEFASQIPIIDYSAISAIYGYIKTFAGISQSTQSTPAITSGTALQNVNPYAVNVYIYGGTVTEIQITKNGTAYTVFSNSTGSALSGQVYKLNPTDSITVTYTTAPTWEWLSD